MRHTVLGLAVGLTLSGGPTLRAGGPIGVCDSGVPLLWPDGGVGIPFNPDLGDLGPLAHDDAVALVASAFQAWADVASATPTYVNAGELPEDVTIDNFIPYLFAAAPDGYSAVVFDHTGEIFDLLYGPDSGILGFAGPEWIDPTTCTILEGLCFLNGPAFAGEDEEYALTYAFDVMVHEFGHYSGLGHTVVNGQLGLGDTSGPTPHDTFGLPDFFADIIETMYPFYFGPGIGTGSPEADDIGILSTLYPEPDFLSDTATITGTILASNGTTPVTGANVIARNLANPFEDAVSALSGNYSAFEGDAFTGTYTLNGLTPGAEYAVFVDQVEAGGFSSPLRVPLPGPEEFYSPPDETGLASTDDPSVYTPVPVTAGTAVTDVNIIFNGYEPGDPLPLGDDGFIELPLPFPFTICQQTFESVWVNANGNLTFGEPEPSFAPSVGGLLGGPPRVAGLWTDLNLTAGGNVTFSQTADLFSVVWEEVPEFPDVGAVSLTIKLYRTGNRVDVEFGAVSATGGVAGVSCGYCATSGLETPVDLSPAVARRSRMSLWRQAAVFEEFGDESPFDLATKTALFQATANYHDNWAGANNTLETAKLVALPFSSAPMARYTEIEPVGGDVDFFRFHVEGGERIKAEIVRGCFDSLIGLFSSEGELLALDDDGGLDLLSKLTYVALEAGEYVLAVSAFADFGFTGAGGSGGRYVLELKTDFCGGATEPGPDNWLVNGGFESGDFTGWTAADTGVPFVDWAVSDDSGVGFFGPIVPQEGCYAAVNGFDGDGPMESSLFQEFAIPADASVATLEWQDHLIYDLFNYGAAEDREYYVFVFDPETGVPIEVLYFLVAEAGTFEDTGWMSHSADLSAYIGQTIGLGFLQFIPESFSGPGQYELDGVRVRTE